jgi:hypothetical protein
MLKKEKHVLLAMKKTKYVWKFQTGLLGEKLISLIIFEYQKRC